jgi:hypothetical protein
VRELVLADPAQKVVLEDYLQTVDSAVERVGRYEAAMGQMLEAWALKPAVEALMAFRGFQLVAATQGKRGQRREKGVRRSVLIDADVLSNDFGVSFRHVPVC